jgi:hypothetical protein
MGPPMAARIWCIFDSITHFDGILTHFCESNGPRSDAAMTAAAQT